MRPEIVQMRVEWGDQVLSIHRLARGQSFWLADAPGAARASMAVPREIIGGGRAPFVRATAEGWSVLLLPGAPLASSDATPSAGVDGARELRLPPGGRVRQEAGGLVFLVERCSSEAFRHSSWSGVDWRRWGCLGVSVLAHVAGLSLSAKLAHPPTEAERDARWRWMSEVLARTRHGENGENDDTGAIGHWRRGHEATLAPSYLAAALEARDDMTHQVTVARAYAVEHLTDGCNDLCDWASQRSSSSFTDVQMFVCRSRCIAATCADLQLTDDRCVAAASAPEPEEKLAEPRLRSDFRSGARRASVRGSVSATVVDAIIARNPGRFRWCHEEGLARAPELAGRITVRFVIGDEGQVVSASDAGSSLRDRGVVDCVVASVRGLTFPPPDRGVAVATVALDFAPGERR